MRVDTLQLHAGQLEGDAAPVGGIWRQDQRAICQWLVRGAARRRVAGWCLTTLPSGRLNTENWFLPTIGAKWEATGNEQVYFNIQKNQRQYQAYGGGGSADPWSTSSQAVRLHQGQWSA
jgi:hypothetical protein